MTALPSRRTHSPAVPSAMPLRSAQTARGGGSAAETTDFASHAADASYRILRAPWWLSVRRPSCIGLPAAGMAKFDSSPLDPSRLSTPFAPMTAGGERSPDHRDARMSAPRWSGLSGFRARRTSR